MFEIGNGRDFRVQFVRVWPLLSKEFAMRSRVSSFVNDGAVH